MFAKHLHELAALEQIPSIINRSMSADTSDSRIAFKYTVVDGSCSESFGIECAELAGWNPEIVKVARDKLNVYIHNANRGKGDIPDWSAQKLAFKPGQKEIFNREKDKRKPNCKTVEDIKMCMYESFVAADLLEWVPIARRHLFPHVFHVDDASLSSSSTSSSSDAMNIENTTQSA